MTIEKKRVHSDDVTTLKARALHSLSNDDAPEKKHLTDAAMTKEQQLALEMGEFEDPFEDEFESEVESSDNDDHEMDKAEDMSVEEDADESMEEVTENISAETESKEKNEIQVYLPGVPLEEGEELQVDTSAYHMLHSLSVKWPCLSFDILQDRLGLDRTTFPHTAYIVAGSQADRPINNELYVMKMSQLCKTKDHESDDDESDGDAEDDPILEHKKIKFFGGVNRIRSMPTSTSTMHYVAAWSEMGKVQIYDLTNHVGALDSPELEANERLSPLYTVSGHKSEGFALDWSRKTEGRLLSGDCSNVINLTEATPNGFNTTMTFSGHSGSVEDLQWSPNEPSVFASCSVDGTVKLFDTRLGAKPGISSRIAQCDVNVIAWNPLTTFLLASGHDDGVFSIWDLRMFARAQDKKNVQSSPAAHFDWHKKAITSLEWHSHEESMIAVAGADNQITLWDLSTEKDDQTDSGTQDITIPAQLLFIHQGQEDIKEIHWHKQIPGCLISTASSGFNIFKTINS